MYKVIREVCEEIWKALQPAVLPQPDRFIWKQSEGFFNKWQFPNCIGALDGKHIRIKAPSNSGSKYFCYKKFFSIVLMAICDHKYRFLWVDIGQFMYISDCNMHIFFKALLRQPKKNIFKNIDAHD